ncbi:MAG: hypothetical protein H8D46_01480 [FCB group bacterium]|nr:hypothetical protein [FCB group bacterium]
MKKIMFFMTVGLVVFACNKADDHAGHDHENMSNEKMEMNKNAGPALAENEHLIYYTCPMDEHKQIHSREAGKCSECGMKLVPGVVTTEAQMDFYGCPMLIHSHIRQEEPGRCDDCGMVLMPMRLVKS